MKKLMMVVCVVSLLSACTSDPRSMWSSKYAFKSVGQVMAMCNGGDSDACYAAADMQGLQAGLNQANNQMMQQQALQAQQQAAQRAAMPVQTTCNAFGNTVNCTTY
ncbi:hypothetical protein RRK80_004703 [Salmonella enterica]|nr:hypothetical protein [Salmonella enterica]